MIHNLSDFPYNYTTPDKWVQDWHNDPNHNKEPQNVAFVSESDKRVERLFIGQQGQVWIVWHITDIPEPSDNPDYKHIVDYDLGFAAKDGMITVVSASLYFTHKRALNAIRETIAELAMVADTVDEPFYSHVYELNEM